MTDQSESPAPEDDGLTIPEVGDWSRDKHHFLRRYLDAFTTSMKDKSWKGLHYLDLFAGAGIERLKKSGQLDWGSPLLAAQTRFPFTRLHLCEKNRARYNALCERIGRFRLPSEPQILHGDANARVADILAEVPKGTLSFAFLDPYGLHLRFSTICSLSQRRLDLIIFFPDHLDALRNWKIYEAKPDSNLDRFMGEHADWLSALKHSPQSKWAEALKSVYIEQMRGLGYRFFDYARISAHGHPLYQLIFCSRHRMPAKLWRGIASKQPDGQWTLDFPEPGL